MRMLMTGASGQLGAYLLRELRSRAAAVAAWSGSRESELFGYHLQPVDLSDRDVVARAFRAAAPQTVIHAAALAGVAACHAQPERARQINVHGTEVLAELSAEVDARLILISTDLVFDGKRGAYREEDAPAPLSVYGKSKQAAEPVVLAVPGGVVARVSLLYGPTLTGRPAFFDQQADALRHQTPITLFEDEWRTPLDLAAAARAVVELACSDYAGILHIGGPERLSRLEMGRRLAAFLGMPDTSIIAARREESPAAEPRAADVSLDSRLWRRWFPEIAWPGYLEALASLPWGQAII